MGKGMVLRPVLLVDFTRVSGEFQALFFLWKEDKNPVYNRILKSCVGINWLSLF
jgi:hypothetical protein